MTPLDNPGINSGFLLMFCFYVVLILFPLLSLVYLVRQLRRAAAHRDDLSAAQRDMRRLLEESLAAQRETNELLRKLIEHKSI